MRRERDENLRMANENRQKKVQNQADDTKYAKQENQEMIEMNRR